MSRVTRNAIVVGALVLAACSNEPGTSVSLPVALQALTAEQAEDLEATIEIEGVLAETPLVISDDLSEASGEFPVAAEAVTGAAVTVRLRYAPSDEQRALLGRLEGSVDIIPGRANELELPGEFTTCGTAVDESYPCELALNLNRNDRSNLEDLEDGIDPFPPPPFVDLAPQDLQFASGISLGQFAQQVILIQNDSPNPVELSATLIGAPGVTISPFDAEDDPENAAQRTIILGDAGSPVPPFSERFLAVSFAPVNQFLTKGVVFVNAVDTVTRVRQSSSITILANADGELRPAPSDLQIAPINPEADLGGFPVDAVQVFSESKLANGVLSVTDTQENGEVVDGLPFRGRNLSVNFGDGPAAFPADAAFVLNIPAQNRLSVALQGLSSDVDMTLFLLDENDNIIAEREKVLRNAAGGDSEEALELRNTEAEDQRALLVLGRVEIDALAEDGSDDSAGEVEGNQAQQALSLDEPAPYSLTALASQTPEFTAPPSPTSGALEGGNRVLLTGVGFDERATVLFSGRRALDCEHSLGDDGVSTFFICTVPPGSLDVASNPSTIVVSNPPPEEQGDGQAATLVRAYTYEPPAPRLDAVTPDLAATDGGAQITLRGAFFSAREALPVVRFGNTLASEVEFVDSTRLQVTAPAQGAGIVSVSVQNVLTAADPEAEPAVAERLSLPSNSRNFRYVVPVGPAPIVNAVAPASVSIDGTETISISGENFVAGSTVTVDGIEASAVNIVGATSLTARVPARDTAGAVDVSVVGPDGQSGIFEDGLTYFIPAPAVNSVIPGQGTTEGGTVCVVKGEGFRAGISVHFERDGARVESPNVNRVSQATLIVSSPSVAAGGSYDIVVTNPSGAEPEAALEDSFEYITPQDPPPVIATLSPSTGSEIGGDTVTLTGVDFSGNPPAILFGTAEVPPPSVTDFSTDGDTDFITFTTPPSEPGPVIVRLINQDGQSDSTFFTYVNELGPPFINILSPDEGREGTRATLDGANFDVDAGALATGASLTIGTRDVTVVSASANQIVFDVPNLDDLIPVGVEVAAMTLEMQNGDGQSATSTFRYERVEDAQPPAISSVSPSVALVGQSVTITGSNFSLQTLQVGDIALVESSVTHNATSITFDVPNATPGVVSVRVINVDGQTDASTIEVIAQAAPVIDSLSPSELALAGGEVTINGQNFDDSATVTLGGQAVSANVAATQITFTAPLVAGPTTQSVRVQNPDGQSASVLLNFAEPGGNGDPEVSLVSPEFAHAGVPGDRLSVVGQALGAVDNAQIVDLGGNTFAANLISSSNSLVVVEVDAALAEGTYRVRLLQGATQLDSPTFEAKAPRSFLAEVDSREDGFFIGEFFNPDQLTALVARPAGDPPGTNEVNFTLLSTSETFLLIRAEAQFETPPGVPLLVELVYGAVRLPIDPDGLLPPLGREPLGCGIENFPPADTELDGLTTRCFKFEARPPNEFGAPVAMRILDAQTRNVVNTGTWTDDNDNEITLTFGPGQLPEGEYLVELESDVSPTLFFSNFFAGGNIGGGFFVDQVNPNPVDVAGGIDFLGSFPQSARIVVEEDGGQGFIAVFDAGIPGSNFQDDFASFPDHAIPPGTYRACARDGQEPDDCPDGVLFDVTSGGGCNGLTAFVQADLDSLNGCTVVAGDLIIDPGFAGDPSLPDLGTLQGSLIVLAAAASTVNAPLLSQIDNDLVIDGAGIGDFGGLGALQTIGGQLIVTNSGISDFTGLANVSSLQGLHVFGNLNVATFNGLNGVNDIGEIVVHNNANLFDVTGFGPTQNLGGLLRFEMRRNPSLPQAQVDSLAGALSRNCDACGGNQFAATCNNGLVEAPEQCDSTPGCDGACTIIDQTARDSVDFEAGNPFLSPFPGQEFALSQAQVLSPINSLNSLPVGSFSATETPPVNMNGSDAAYIEMALSYETGCSDPLFTENIISFELIIDGSSFGPITPTRGAYPDVNSGQTPGFSLSQPAFEPFGFDVTGFAGNVSIRVLADLPFTLPPCDGPTSGLFIDDFVAFGGGGAAGTPNISNLNPDPVRAGQRVDVFLDAAHTGVLLGFQDNGDGTGVLVEDPTLTAETNTFFDPNPFSGGSVAFCTAAVSPGPGTYNYSAVCDAPEFVAPVLNCEFNDLRSAPGGAYVFSAGGGVNFDPALGWQPGNRNQFLARDLLAPPYFVEVTLQFAGDGEIAFVGTRFDGAAIPGANDEPDNLVYTRIHNFPNSQTNLALRNNGNFDVLENIDPTFPGGVVNGEDYLLTLQDDGDFVTMDLVRVSDGSPAFLSFANPTSSGSHLFLSGTTVRYRDLTACSAGLP